MNMNEYSHCTESLGKFLKKNTHRPMAELIAEYSATTGVPIIICYEYAKLLTNEIEFCDTQLSRLKEFYK